ncbi:MAG: hypothetical protein R3F60_17300 [bacterium]
MRHHHQRCERARQGTVWVVALAVLAACGEVDRGQLRGLIDADAGPLATWDEPADPGPAPVDRAPPTISILRVDVAGGRATIAGQARDDVAVVAVEIGVGASGPYPARLVGERFEATVPLPATGPADLSATAFDATGQAATARRVVEGPPPVSARAPVVLIDEPTAGTATTAERVVLRGRVQDEDGVVAVEVEGRLAGDLGVARTADHFGHWSLSVPLAVGATERFTARARNAAGRVGEASVEVRSRRAPPHGPPVVEVAPADGALVPTLRVAVVARALSAVPLDRVVAQVGDGPWQALAAGADGFRGVLRLSPGANTVTLLATDVDGLVSRVDRQWQADDGAGDGPRVVLRAPRGGGGRVVLDLDRAGVAALSPRSCRLGRGW